MGACLREEALKLETKAVYVAADASTRATLPISSVFRLSFSVGWDQKFGCMRGGHAMDYVSVVHSV